MTRVLWLSASLPLLRHKLEYFSQDFMSSCGERTRERTLRIFCQSSTTRWQPCSGEKLRGSASESLRLVLLGNEFWFIITYHEKLRVNPPPSYSQTIKHYPPPPPSAPTGPGMRCNIAHTSRETAYRQTLTTAFSLTITLTWSLFHHVLLMASLRSGTSLNWIISSSSDNICTLTIACMWHRHNTFTANHFTWWRITFTTLYFFYVRARLRAVCLYPPPPPPPHFPASSIAIWILRFLQN